MRWISGTACAFALAAGVAQAGTIPVWFEAIFDTVDVSVGGGADPAALAPATPRPGDRLRGRLLHSEANEIRPLVLARVRDALFPDGYSGGCVTLTLRIIAAIETDGFDGGLPADVVALETGDPDSPECQELRAEQQAVEDLTDAVLETLGIARHSFPDLTLFREGEAEVFPFGVPPGFDPTSPQAALLNRITIENGVPGGDAVTVVASSSRTGGFAGVLDGVTAACTAAEIEELGVNPDGLGEALQEGVFLSFEVRDTTPTPTTADLLPGSLLRIAGGVFPDVAGADLNRFSVTFVDLPTVVDPLAGSRAGAVSASCVDALTALSSLPIRTVTATGRIVSLSDAPDPTPPVSAPVPGPAGLPLALAGLGGLAWTGRRRRRSRTAVLAMCSDRWIASAS